ncbi:MAG TPA: phosphoribosyltransferase family protein [Longimicrobium sp.]|nr:phosphoribosyltransferase family protein [Longimicrobium sp.]
MNGGTFADRADAGQRLAARLSAYARQNDVVVLALPRGGVPVGYEVARTLGAPLDVLVVRKLGVPGHEELAMGAVAGGGVRVLDAEVVRFLHIPPGVIQRVSEAERAEVERRERAYRGNRPAPEVRGRTVILVDDGIATGSTCLAAIQALRQREPARVVVAAPVAPASTCRALRQAADEVVCVREPEYLGSVGGWYRSFPQTSDHEVRAQLARSMVEPAAAAV